jgi:hypothetical protein
MTWHGWIRQDGRWLWEHVCSAEGMGECARQLGRIGRERGIASRDQLLTASAEQPQRRLYGRRQAGLDGADGPEGHPPAPGPS